MEESSTGDCCIRIPIQNSQIRTYEYDSSKLQGSVAFACPAAATRGTYRLARDSERWRERDPEERAEPRAEHDVAWHSQSRAQRVSAGGRRRKVRRRYFCKE